MSVLQFESSLESRILRPTLRKKGRMLIRLAVTACTALAIAAAIGASVWSLMPARGSDGVRRLSAGFVDGLKTADYDRALALCEVSDRGAQLLDQDDARILKAKPGGRATPGALRAARAARLDQFRQLHDQAGTVGLDWANAIPVAFVGVRASVFDPVSMQAPAESITGLVCIESAGRVFGIELTARHCGSGEYIITGVWQLRPLDVPRSGLKALSKARYREFLEEPASPDSPDAVQKAKRLYVSL